LWRKCESRFRVLVLAWHTPCFIWRMPEPDDLQVLIMLSLIPLVIAAMYSLVQAIEEMRDRVRPRDRTRGRA